MNTLEKRFLTFLLICIPTRTAIALIPKYVNINYLPFLGYLALLPAIGFAYIFIFGKRKTVGETFGQKIWWNYLRPVHAFLYLSFGILAIQKNNNAYIPLLIDVIIGLIGFLNKRLL